jgi:hypothetical protein
MIRKQIYIAQEQEEQLKRRSKELGISEAALIRHCIQEAVDHPTSGEREKVRQELLASMKERAKIQVPQTGRTWTREELYEERLERYPR